MGAGRRTPRIDIHAHMLERTDAANDAEVTLSNQRQV